MNEREYDRIHNEGGEGYNPYREDREKKEFEAHKEWLKTRNGRKSTIYRDLEKLDCSIARECGTYDKNKIDALRAELKQIEAEEEAEKEAAFISEWTLEVTISRLAEWNAFMMDLGIISGKNVTARQRREVYKRMHDQGWLVDDLRKAVKYHLYREVEKLESMTRPSQK